MAGSQQIMGIASGMDTGAIIDALMNVEKSTTTTRTQTKIDSVKLKLEAYRQVNNLLTTFSSAMAKLSDSSLWSSKTATTSNESALKATANEYATPGTYQYRVAQLASVAQYLSKGFSSTSAKVSPNKAGTITIDSSKARVDTSASLSDLNGGKGVYRGSIRIQDASGEAAVVDLAACMTVTDVVKAINSAGGVAVKATVNEDGNGFTLEDYSEGSGTLRVQNYGGGTTADDLGLSGRASTRTYYDDQGRTAGDDGVTYTSQPAGGSTVVTLQGGSVWRMGDNTALSALNDGTGVEKGQAFLAVTDASGTEHEVVFDLRHATTVGEALETINAAIEKAKGESAEAAAAFGDLEVSVSADGRSLQWTGLKSENSYETGIWVEDLENDWGRAETMDQLGLMLGNATAKLRGVEGTVTGKTIFGAMDSPMISSLSGVNGDGVGGTPSGMTVPVDLARDTALGSLRGGTGIPGYAKAVPEFTLFFNDGVNGAVEFSLDASDPAWKALVQDPGASMGDVLDYLNSKLAADPATAHLSFDINDAKDGLTLRGLRDTDTIYTTGNMADALGVQQFRTGANTADYVGLQSDDAGAAVSGATKLSELHTRPELGSTAASALLLGSDHWTNTSDLSQGLKADIFTVRVGSGATVDLLDGFVADGDTTLQSMLDYANGKLHDAMGLTGTAENYLSVAADGSRLVVDSSAIRTAAGGEDVYLAGALATDLGTQVRVKATPTVEEYKSYVDLRATQAGITSPDTFGLSDKLGDLVDASGAKLSSALTGTAAFTVTLGEKAYSFTLADVGYTDGDTVQQYMDKVNTKLASIVAQAKTDGAIAADSTLSLKLAATQEDGAAAGVYSALGIQFSDDPDAVASESFSVAMPTDGGRTRAFAEGTTQSEVATAYQAATVGTPVYSAVDMTGLGSIKLTYNDGSGAREVTLDTDGLDSGSSLNDLIRKLNAEAEANGLTGLTFRINDVGNGIAVDNASGGSVTFLDDPVQKIAADLGLAGQTVRQNSYQNGGDLDRKYLSRATALTELNGGAGVPKGSFQIKSAYGELQINIQDATTLGDIVDLINYYGELGVTARINDTGDGLLIESVDGQAFSIEEMSGGTSATKLGIVGESKVDEKTGKVAIDGSFERKIEVSTEDTLQDIMYKIDDSGAPVNASIIQDGSANPHVLSVKADASGAAGDFVLDTDLSVFGFQQAARGKDSVLLYGDPDGDSSPIALRSSTNTNNKALLGVTLELTGVTSDYVSVTVGQDKSQIVGAMEEMVSAYNDFLELYQYLDSYDEETGEKGILQGDYNLRKLVNEIGELFYSSVTKTDSDGAKKTISFFDLGVGFESASYDSGYYTSSLSGKLTLDTSVLQDMVDNNFEWVRDLIASNADMALSSQGGEAYGNGNHVEGYGPENLIDGNTLASSRGYMASTTIADGNNQVVVNFEKGQYLDYLSIKHWNSSDEASADYAIRDFVVEYLDQNGKWQEARTVTGNTNSSTIVTFAGSTYASAIRITASSTNAADGLFRLSEVSAYAETGLVGSVNRTLSSLTDTIDGWWATHKSDIESQITSLEETLAKQEERLTQIEDRLMRQYTAMEVALSKLQQQGDYMTTQLEAMKSVSSNNK